jgi:hypothetical protein
LVFGMFFSRRWSQHFFPTSRDLQIRIALIETVSVVACKIFIENYVLPLCYTNACFGAVKGHLPNTSESTYLFFNLPKNTFPSKTQNNNAF